MQIWTENVWGSAHCSSQANFEGNPALFWGRGAAPRECISSWTYYRPTFTSGHKTVDAERISCLMKTHWNTVWSNRQSQGAFPVFLCRMIWLCVKRVPRSVYCTAQTQQSVLYSRLGSLGLHGMSPTLNMTVMNPEHLILGWFSLRYSKNIMSKFSVEPLWMEDPKVQKCHLVSCPVKFTAKNNVKM